jgi:hypothetical protein
MAGGDHEGPDRYSAAADIQPAHSAFEHSDSRSECGIDAAMNGDHNAFTCVFANTHSG